MHTFERTALRASGSESEFADKVLTALSKWFDIETQVYGDHPDGRVLRLDAVLQPNDSMEDWKDDYPAFGVEFKLSKDNGKASAQAIDYSQTNWRKGHGRLGIFLCTTGKGFFPPEKEEHSRYEVEGRSVVVIENAIDANFKVAHLLGQFNVGELCYSNTHNYGWILVRHQRHILWSEGYGVMDAATSSIRPKVGSR